MTHSLYFKVLFGDWESLNDFIYEFINDDEFIDTYQLKKSEYADYRMYGDQQPFIYFPDKDGEKPYISIETGSHVAPEDRLYSLQWYYFTLAFIDRFKDEIKELGGRWYYEIEGEELHLNEKQMLNEIREDRSHVKE